MELLDSSQCSIQEWALQDLDVQDMLRRRYLLRDSALEVPFQTSFGMIFLECGSSEKRTELAKALSDA